MKFKYITTLLMLCLFISCQTDETIDNGEIGEKDPVDYSMFMASIDNSLSDKIVSRAISYVDSATPNLSVYFEDGNIASYTYNDNNLYYEVDDATQMGDKALYVYSSEMGEDSNGALVAASWPELFETNPATEISLRNVKPQVRINYKYADTEEIASVSTVSLCQIYSAGEFSALPTLVYTATGDLGEVVASETTDIYASVLTDDQAEGDVTYITGAYELYAAPQVLSTYDAYVKFTIDGEDHLYYFKDKVSFESYYSYDMVFEIKMFEGAVDIELTEQSKYADWEDEGDGLIVTIDPANKFDTWDGSAISTSLEGAGTDNDPYLIQSAADLNYVLSLTSGSLATTYLSANYRLEKNIDWNSNSWSMIGTYSTPFLGLFDGNGYTIKNIAISYSWNSAGLFRYVGTSSTSAVTSYQGEIKNLSLTGVINGSAHNTAGFVGNAAPTSNIENCHFSGTVLGSYAVGGIVGSGEGRIAGCSVMNSTITATTESTGTTKGAGGIVGQLWTNTNIRFEHNLVLNCKVSSAKETSAGGLIGSTWTQWQPSYNSFAKNITTDNESDMFGLIGYTGAADADPTTDTYSYLYQNSYYTGDVAYNDAAYYLDSANYTMQEMCNMLNYGDASIEYNPSENAAGWYWAVSNTYDSPMPVYNSK